MTSHASKEKNPQQIVEEIVIKALTEVYQGENISPEIRSRAKELVSRFSYTDATYLGPEAKRAAGREYDEWIDESLYDGNATFPEVEGVGPAKSVSRSQLRLSHHARYPSTLRGLFVHHVQGTRSL